MSWLRGVASVLFTVASIGCKAKEAPPASTGSAPAGSGSARSGSAVAAIGDIKITLAGEPLVPERALIKTLPDGRAQLYIGTSGTCEQLMSNMFDGKDPHLLVDLVHLLLADGKDSVGVGDVWAGPPTKADAQARGDIRGELTKGGKVGVDLAVRSNEGKFDVKGTVTAEVCGDQDAPPPATAGAATMKIAGRDFVIRSALKRGDDIELVDLPRDCSSAQYIGIRIKREGGTWGLDGTRMPVPLTGPAPALTVKPAPTKESPGPGHVMMALGGSDKIAAYDVALAGVVDMIDCNYTPPKK